MAINMFEGARRIAMLIAVFIVVGFGIVIVDTRPESVSVTYRIDEIDKPPVRLMKCGSGTVASTREVTSRSGDLIKVTLCIKQSRAVKVQFEDDSTHTYQNVPGKVTIAEIEARATRESSKSVKKVQDFSNEFDRFLRVDEESDVWTAFQVPETDQSFLSRSVSIQAAKHFGVYLLGMLASLAGWWAFTWAAGWIVRGFMGIPRGSDSR
jgi:hypothetical protein